MESSGISVRLFEEDIGGVIEWSINRPRHVLVVHLGGQMDSLETEIDGRRTSVGAALPGECWFVPAGARYASAAQGGMIRYAEVELDPSALSLSTSWPAIAAHADPLMARLALAVAQGDDHAAAALEERIACLAERPAPDRKARQLPTGVADDLIRRIEQQLEDPVLLGDMAKQAGLSVNGFLNAFTMTFGITPAQYLIRQRLRRAQWHLAHGDLDITSIAMRTGFSSHAHLTSTFSGRFGQTPSQWRRVVKKGLVSATQEASVPRT